MLVAMSTIRLTGKNGVYLDPCRGPYLQVYRFTYDVHLQRKWLIVPCPVLWAVPWFN